MDMECPGCCKISTTFSCAQMTVWCVGCRPVLRQPTGGKARLPEGCTFRRKQHWKKWRGKAVPIGAHFFGGSRVTL
ncbi:40S ribosomal protein S27-like [Artibeus jamaicensis]|uniref:40S ribosomal protein S27-like n=1 Tax=Artibeus jamaicensis TaxID=9417 RepID=UPI00235A7619|nr:40S ribosomal protein S27-like [Artibeus jamaicensis]